MMLVQTLPTAGYSRRTLPDKLGFEADGMVWVSWPKKAPKVPTDVTEDVVPEAALKPGLVDVTVAAIDDVWSGCKLMIRKECRQ
jgi:hypothetical protein